jgi:hypothetical protein
VCANPRWHSTQGLATQMLQGVQPGDRERPEDSRVQHPLHAAPVQHTRFAVSPLYMRYLPSANRQAPSLQRVPGHTPDARHKQCNQM